MCVSANIVTYRRYHRTLTISLGLAAKESEMFEGTSEAISRRHIVARAQKKVR